MYQEAPLFNANFDTQVAAQQIPLERLFVQNGLGNLTGNTTPVTLPERLVKQAQAPVRPSLPRVNTNTSYFSKKYLTQPETSVQTVPAATPVQTPDYSTFNLDDMLKSTIYEKDGKWVSDNPFVNRFIQVESSGNPRALNPSGAAGLYQFTPTTGAAYGLPGDTRYDPQKSHAAFLRLVQDNAAKLIKYGIPVTPANLYFMHQQGGGFWYIWQAAQKGVPIANTKVDRNMRNNLLPGMSYDISPADWISQWTAHFNQGLGL
jgi:hypothetical protein